MTETIQGVRIRDVMSKIMIDRIKNNIRVRVWKGESDFLLWVSKITILNEQASTNYDQ